MLSLSFSGTTVWHTARRVRNSWMQGAVGCKREPRSPDCRDTTDVHQSQVQGTLPLRILDAFLLP